MSQKKIHLLKKFAGVANYSRFRTRQLIRFYKDLNMIEKSRFIGEIKNFLSLEKKDIPPKVKPIS